MRQTASGHQIGPNKVDPFLVQIDIFVINMWTINFTVNAFKNSFLSPYANFRSIILEYGNLSGHGWPFQEQDFSVEIQVHIFKKCKFKLKFGNFCAKMNRGEQNRG